MTRLDLSTKAITEQRKAKRQLRSDFDRFRDAVGKEGCAVLVVSKGVNYPVIVCRKRGKLNFLKLDKSVARRAEAVVDEENKKLAEKGVGGRWIDGERLAVQRINFVTSEALIEIKVRKVLLSQILAMENEPFEKINEAGMRRLDTNSHLLAFDKAGGRNFRVLLVAERGVPGNAKRFMLAANGMVDAGMLRNPPDEIIGRNSTKEFGEEFGMRNIRYESVSFEGLVVDTHFFTGAFGVVTSISVPLEVSEINRMRTVAADGNEIGDLHVVEDTPRSIAAFLKEKRSNCVPQLVSGLVIYGYNRYGYGFLKEATK